MGRKQQIGILYGALGKARSFTATTYIKHTKFVNKPLRDTKTEHKPSQVHRIQPQKAHSCSTDCWKPLSLPYFQHSITGSRIREQSLLRSCIQASRTWSLSIPSGGIQWWHSRGCHRHSASLASWINKNRTYILGLQRFQSLPKEPQMHPKLHSGALERAKHFNCLH